MGVISWNRFWLKKQSRNESRGIGGQCTAEEWGGGNKLNVNAELIFCWRPFGRVDQLTWRVGNLHPRIASEKELSQGDAPRDGCDPSVLAGDGIHPIKSRLGRHTRFKHVR